MPLSGPTYELQMSQKEKRKRKRQKAYSNNGGCKLFNPVGKTNLHIQEAQRVPKRPIWRQWSKLPKIKGGEDFESNERCGLMGEKICKPHIL